MPNERTFFPTSISIANPVTVRLMSRMYKEKKEKYLFGIAALIFAHSTAMAIGLHSEMPSILVDTVWCNQDGYCIVFLRHDIDFLDRKTMTSTLSDGKCHIYGIYEAKQYTYHIRYECGKEHEDVFVLQGHRVIIYSWSYGTWKSPPSLVSVCARKDSRVAPPSAHRAATAYERVYGFKPTSE